MTDFITENEKRAQRACPGIKIAARIDGTSVYVGDPLGEGIGLYVYHDPEGPWERIPVSAQERIASGDLRSLRIEAVRCSGGDVWRAREILAFLRDGRI